MIDFSVLPSYIAQLILVAIVVEALSEIVKDNLPLSVQKGLNADAKKLIALLMTALCFAVAPLTPFKSIGQNLVINIAAILAVARGSNFLHDFMKLIQESANAKKKA